MSILFVYDIFGLANQPESNEAPAYGLFEQVDYYQLPCKG